MRAELGEVGAAKAVEVRGLARQAVEAVASTVERLGETEAAEGTAGDSAAEAGAETGTAGTEAKCREGPWGRGQAAKVGSSGVASGSGAGAVGLSEAAGDIGIAQDGEPGDSEVEAAEGTEIEGAAERLGTAGDTETGDAARKLGAAGDWDAEAAGETEAADDE